VAQKHVAEYRRRAAQRKLLRDLRQAAREIAEANQRIATEGGLREAEARRAARNRALVWGPGRGLTA